MDSGRHFAFISRYSEAKAIKIYRYQYIPFVNDSDKFFDELCNHFLNIQKI